jgi:hypothetical protein
LAACVGEPRTQFPLDMGEDSLLLLRDAELDEAIPDQTVYPWDAGPDAERDAEADSGSPVVCTPAGLQVGCQIEGLLGPCAEGLKACLVTEYSQCRQQNFPRTETCDHIDNDCDGRLNEAPPQSQLGTLAVECYDGPLGTQKVGICHGGVAFCERLRYDGPTEEQYGYGTCSNQLLPAFDEECDGFDNDCDALTDEGVLNACGECGEVPLEVCDALDNDCDTLTDEGVLNACGECGAVPDELCDFLDNDCDGAVDEGTGDCVCENPLYVPQPEICNGADEDCDGFIDEGPDGGPLTKLCSTDVRTGELLLFDRREDGPDFEGGICRVGLSFCEESPEVGIDYGYFECLQEISPRIERCNGIDDDCDGQVDEHFVHGRVAVLMVIDVSGSMRPNELTIAFEATVETVEALHNAGANAICYMLAIVGNDDMPDPYLYAPAHNCVPGVEDPVVAPIEDMRAAVEDLRAALHAGTLNQGGASENTYDAIGKFFTDDLIDWDNDGILDDVEWQSSVGVHRVDLSGYENRIVVVLGDEVGQGDEFDHHNAARAMGQAQGGFYIIGPDPSTGVGGMVEASYRQLLDIGGVYIPMGVQRWREEEEIAVGIQQALEEAGCINGQ